MSRFTIAQGCFYGIGIATVLLGCVYTFAPAPMPYHLAAMEVSWEHFTSNQQRVIIAILTGSGSGMLATGIAIVLMTFFAVRKREHWARSGILALGLVQIIPTLYSITQIRTHTPGRPPLAMLIIVFAILLLGFFLSAPRKIEPQDDET